MTFAAKIFYPAYLHTPSALLACHVTQNCSSNCRLHIMITLTEYRACNRQRAKRKRRTNVFSRALLCSQTNLSGIVFIRLAIQKYVFTFMC